MIVDIKCSVCAEIIGRIEKDVVTEEDVALYQQMVSCSQGHNLVQLEEEA